MIKRFNDFHNINESVYSDEKFDEKLDSIENKFVALEIKYNNLELTQLFNSYQVSFILKETRELYEELDKLHSRYVDVENEISEEDYDEAENESSDIYSKYRSIDKKAMEMLENLEQAEKAIEDLKGVLVLYNFKTR